MLAAVLAFVFATLAPDVALAWGFTGHKLMMRRAIDLLPGEIRPFFVAFQDEIVLRVIDPDLWRSVGWEENPHHFIDFGVPEYGDYPFTALPREYGAALEKFGAATLKRNGLLPWREAEQFGNLRRAFEDFKRSAPYTTSDTVLFAAVVSHYAQDAHQPFHATDNYDGQRTGNSGIHSRFERDLIERFQSRLTLRTSTVRPILHPRDAAFDALLESYQLVDRVLQADREASAGKDTYDDEYFEKLFRQVQPILEERMAKAISVTAGLIAGAWEQAGRPSLRVRDARPAQKVRAPR